MEELVVLRAALAVCDAVVETARITGLQAARRGDADAQAGAMKAALAIAPAWGAAKDCLASSRAADARRAAAALLEAAADSALALRQILAREGEPDERPMSPGASRPDRH